MGRPGRASLLVALPLVVLSAAAAAAPPAALPEDQRQLALVAPEPAPVPLVQLLDHGIRVEGKLLEAAPGASAARLGGVWLLPLAPISEQLGNTLRREGERVTVVRSQDGAVFTLDLASGEVRVNGEPLGYAPVVDVPRDGALLLPVEAVEVMTGTHVFLDEDAREFVLRLDDRLRQGFGFEIVVDGRPLLAPAPEPRSVGSVLLLPLLPILEVLGGELERSADGRVLTVVRAQDRAVLRLDLESGLALLDEEPVGIVPDIRLSDPDALLLPKDAVALLTGTHIEIEAATQIVRVELDPALTGILEPRDDIWAEARREPFTFESVDYRFGNDVTNRLRLRSRQRTLDYDLRYETPDWMRPDRPEPSFYQLRMRSLAGVSGTLGEYTSVRRELAGVGVSRIRGASLQLPVFGRDSTFVLGQPATGTHVLDSDRSVPAYEGWVFGGRLYGDEDRFELGFSGGSGRDGRSGGGTAGLQHRFDWATAGADEGAHFQSLDLGWFSGPDAEDRPDLRASAISRLAFGRRTSARLRVGYEGLDFRRPHLRDDLDEVLPGADRLLSALELGYRPLQGLDGRLRYAFERERLLAGDPDRRRSLHALTAGFQLQPWRRGPTLQSDYTLSHVTLPGSTAGIGEGLGHQLQASLSQQAWGLRAVARQRVERSALDREVTEITLSRPFSLRAPRDARLSVTPTLVGVHEAGNQAIDAAVAAGFDSGGWLGSRTRLGVDYALSDSLLRSEGERFGRHFFNVGLGYRAFPWALFEVQYRDDFERDRRVFLSLRGSYDHNALRRHRRARPGAGVLAGTIFLDLDRDGTRQEDEPGLGGVPVRLRGTGLALRTDRSGAFTIQNVETGVYELEVGEASLPLGMLVPDGPRRMRVDEGHITRVAVPAIVSGRLRGRIFSDADGSGRFEPGERGLVGVRVTVEPGEREVFTADFGLFALDELLPGRYRLRVDPDSLPPGHATPAAIEVELRDGDMLQRVELGVPPGPPAARPSERAALPR